MDESRRNLLKAAAGLLAVPLCGRVATGKTAIAFASKLNETDVLTSAVMQAGGISEPGDMPLPAWAAAQRRYRGKIGLRQLFLDGAKANGWRGKEVDVACMEACNELGRPVDMPIVLMQSVNAFMDKGFRFVEDEWRKIANVRTVNDFAPSPGLQGFSSIGNYAELLPLSISTIRRDDLGGITSVPLCIGRDAGLKVNFVFWQKVAEAAQQWLLFPRQWKGDGPGYVSAAANILLESAGCADAKGKRFTLIENTTYRTKRQDSWATDEFSRNAVIGGDHELRVSVTRFMRRTAGTLDVPGWGVVLDDLRPMEVAFLNSNQSPRVECVETDLATGDMTLRGSFDFGVAVSRPNGMLHANCYPVE